MKLQGKLSGCKRVVILIALLFLAIGDGLRAQVQVVNCPTGFDNGVPAAPPPLLTSLKTVPNPVFPKDPVTFLPTLRADLKEYIANSTAAIQLGKALFWDMQVGSDNQTACATCHFRAGEDARHVNQVHPGPETTDPFFANAPVEERDFPMIAAHPQSDNILGSQGVRKRSFAGVNSRTGAESTTATADPVFNVGGVNVRQVTGINAPTTINAVFNHRNFWNGRAQPEFNGVNPWGSRDATARVWMAGSKGTPVQTAVRIANASLASQAVGPVLNPVEMSAAGRGFPDVGRKMLLVKPLGVQKVDPGDSVLGGVADRTSGKGLTVSYKTMIQNAFQQKWWNSNKTVTIGGKTYSMMEANFSLYWGLAIMLYESTLISDDSPMDKYLSMVGVNRPGPSHPTAAALNQVAGRLRDEYGYTRGAAGILNGLALFEQPLPPVGNGRECNACHAGANLTSASLQNLVIGGLEPGDEVFRLAGFDVRMERMFMQIPPVPTDLVSMMLNLSPLWLTDQVWYDRANYGVTVTSILGSPDPSIALPAPAPVAVYDAGWYNTGVRPVADDLGLGGTDKNGQPLSWTQLFQTTLADPSTVKVPGAGLACLGAGNATFPDLVLDSITGFPILSGGLRKTEATDVPGSFKTSSLHNAELRGPYFHNGGKATLRQVIEFYDDGGDFAGETVSPLIEFYGFLTQHGMGMSEAEKEDLVAFLLALTDERVRWEKAPFDHPQLFIPNGALPASPGTDVLVELPAVGAAGLASPLTGFLNVNPFMPPPQP